MSFEQSTEVRHVENGSPEAQSKDLAPLTEGRLSNLVGVQNTSRGPLVVLATAVFKNLEADKRSNIRVPSVNPVPFTTLLHYSLNTVDLFVCQGYCHQESKFAIEEGTKPPSTSALCRELSQKAPPFPYPVSKLRMCACENSADIASREQLLGQGRCWCSATAGAHAECESNLR